MNTHAVNQVILGKSDIDVSIPRENINTILMKLTMQGIRRSMSHMLFKTVVFLMLYA